MWIARYLAVYRRYCDQCTGGSAVSKYAAQALPNRLVARLRVALVNRKLTRIIENLTCIIASENERHRNSLHLFLQELMVVKHISRVHVCICFPPQPESLHEWASFQLRREQINKVIFKTFTSVLCFLVWDVYGWISPHPNEPFLCEFFNGSKTKNKY